MMIGWLVSGIFTLVWLALLVHCVRRRAFYPLFDKATKAVWLLGFLLFNPLLMLGYVLFGMIPRPPEPGTRPGRLKLIRALAYAWIVLAILLVNTRAFGPPATPRTMTLDPKGAVVLESGKGALEAGAQIGVLLAETNKSVGTAAGHSENDRLSACIIRIRCDDPHPLLDAAARKLQIMLVNESSVCERVAYYPFGQEPPIGDPLADVFVTLAEADLSVLPLPAGRRIRGTLVWAAGTAPYRTPSFYSDPTSLPVIEFNMNGRLDHKSLFHGIELGSARYQQAARNIAQSIAEPLVKSFDEWGAKHGVMPELPDVVQGTYSPPPALPIIPADAEVLESGFGTLIHNSTVWRFEDERGDDELLSALVSQLTEDGWKGQASASVPSQRMKRGDESIHICRELPMPVTPSPSPIVVNSTVTSPVPVYVHYQRRFSDDETAAAMDAILASADIDTLLLFEGLLRIGNLGDRLMDRLEGGVPSTTGGLFKLVQFYKDRGDDDHARKALLRARVMQYLSMSTNQHQSAIKRLAEELGDPELAEAPLDPQVCRDMGFLDRAEMTFPATLERDLNEPLVLFSVDEDGAMHTIAYRVRPATGPKHLGEFTYACVKSSGGSRSSSRSTPTSPDHVFHDEFEGAWLFVDVKPLGDGRFEFTVRDQD
ncbi:MAG: hypothetical protein GY851_12265 [bacterium]|nr:hypothetical protein [bacterium]